MVPKVGLEPTRYRYRWILSPVRLPVSPLGQRVNYKLIFVITAIISLERLVRVERTTSTFGGLHSNPLSYRRVYILL